MGIAKKTDGRYVVGVGVENANDYKGSAAYRDIYIQLTASGATAKSEEYLTFLKDYAVNANALGEPIMPPSVNVWISNNGVTTAVEADDVSIDGSNYTICGIKWNGSAWDYTDAGKGGGGGGGLPSYTSADKGKVLALGGESSSVDIVPEQELVISGSPTDATSIDNANTEYFVDGATIHVLIKAGIVTDVDEDVTVTQIGSSIETGDIYGKSNTYQFYIESGVLKFWCNYAGSYTVHVTVLNTEIIPVWKSLGSVTTITLPTELNTLLMSTLQSRAPAAIAAGLGKPVYNSGTAEIATDTASLATLFNNIADARDSGNVMILSGGTLVAESTSNRSDKLAGITFVYETYPYTIYTFRILINILVDADYNYYFITSVITLLDTQGGN